MTALRFFTGREYLEPERAHEDGLHWKRWNFSGVKAVALECREAGVTVWRQSLTGVSLDHARPILEREFLAWQQGRA